MTNSCHVALQHIELEKPASDGKLLSSQQDLYRKVITDIINTD